MERTQLNTNMHTKISPLNFSLLCIVVIAVFANLWVWRDDLFGFGRSPAVSQLPTPPVLEAEEENEPTTTTRVPTTIINTTTTEVSTPTSTPIKPTSVIPASINLPVPFTSQAPEKNWEQPWQDACEEATILMLDAYYKGYGLSPLFAKDELIKMVNMEAERGWGLSIEIEKIKQLTEEYGGYDLQRWRLRIVESPTVDDLKRFIANKQPILVVADGKMLDNPHFRNGGPEYHTLIIRGYTPTHFITNDPGTQFGENFIYTHDNLMESIRDWNGGDVKGGRRVVMVVEKV